MEKKNTSDIKFCYKIVQNVLSDSIKQRILDSLSNYNVSITQRDFCILKPNYCSNLKKNEHVIATKSNGNSYYLFMTKYNNVNTCFYIDKKIKDGYKLPRIMIIKQRFDDSLFDDTLIEGELIRTNNDNWLFLFSNLYVFKGKMIEDNMIQKYNILYSILTDDYESDIILDPFKIEIKKIFYFNQFQDLIDNFIPNLPYTIKGILFYPINKKYNNLLYVFNQNDKINSKDKQVDIKPHNVKQNIEHSPENQNTNKIDLNTKCKFENDTIFFKILPSESPDIFNLYLLEENVYILIDVALVQTLKCSKFIKTIFKNNNQTDIIVECKYSIKFKKWEPIKLSENKQSDNINHMKNLMNN